jgi:hypothetical protein
MYSTFDLPLVDEDVAAGEREAFDIKLAAFTPA